MFHQGISLNYHLNIGLMEFLNIHLYHSHKLHSNILLFLHHMKCVLDIQEENIFLHHYNIDINSMLMILLLFSYLYNNNLLSDMFHQNIKLDIFQDMIFELDNLLYFSYIHCSNIYMEYEEDKLEI